MKNFYSYLIKNSKEEIYLNELTHLSDFFTKKGEDFINNLLNKKIVINLKVDFSSFNLKVENNNVSFYGREGRNPINLTKRILIDIYEEPIKYFQSRPLNKLENGLEIYMEYFNDKLPFIIKYFIKPKNNFIISYVKKDGKILLPDDKIIEKISKILNIEPPPILFSGKLNPKQKQKLLNFISLTDDEKISFLEENFNNNFINFILDCLNFSKKEIKFLNATRLEGLVFYFDGDIKNKVVMGKIVDPYFTKIVKKKKKKNKSNDIYLKKLISIIFTEDLIKSAIKIMKQKENYYVFIYKLTLDIFKKKKNILENNLRSYENKLEKFPFGINKNFIPKKLNNLFEKYFYLEDIYRLLLSNLSKRKKRAGNNFEKKHKEIINIIYDLRNKGN